MKDDKIRVLRAARPLAMAHWREVTLTILWDGDRMVYG